MLWLSIFLVSAAVLGLELTLVRALSISHWHHFSYLVISTSLLGFGAGAVAVSFILRYFEGRIRRCLWIFAIGMGVAAPLSFALAQMVNLDELQLIWDYRQTFYLGLYYLLFFVPFFFGGGFVAASFGGFGNQAGKVYFFNMAGSAAGAGIAVLLMYGRSPVELIPFISGAVFLAALLISLDSPIRAIISALAAVAFVAVFSSGGLWPLEQTISENKPLVYYKALPDVRIEHRQYSPIARLDTIRAPSVRHFPGLSMSYLGQVPQQVLIISDAAGISAVNHFEQTAELGTYDYTCSALPYHLISEPQVCVLQAGAGSSVGQALLLGASKVTAVEVNDQIVNLVSEQLGDFSGNIYNRPDVNIVVAEGRTFLHRYREKFDIITMTLGGGDAGGAGLSSLNETHLYTVEAISRAMQRLNDNGLLSINLGLKSPPRDSLKMIATVTQVLESRDDIADPAKHIAIIRSWADATIIVSPKPLSAENLAKIRAFTDMRSFDLVYLPDIEPDEINIFHALDEPVYHEGAMEIITGDAERFFNDYAYNIRPAVDDRPYFFDFFRWQGVPVMIREVPEQWLTLSEWGYLVLVATLAQALAASAIFIILPVWVAKPIRKAGKGKASVMAYFLLLGLAYMLLEMGFIQKLTLLIGHPVFGVAVTLVGFLGFSGLGALAGRWILSRWTAGETSPARRSRAGTLLIRCAIAVTIVVALLELLLLAIGFEWLAGFDRTARIAVGLVITAVPAFFMGMPLPTAINFLYENRRRLIPWAWSVNGFASVNGAVLGTMLAISAGFNNLVIVALCAYLLAAVIAPRVCGQDNN